MTGNKQPCPKCGTYGCTPFYSEWGISGAGQVWTTSKAIHQTCKFRREAELWREHKKRVDHDSQPA